MQILASKESISAEVASKYACSLDRAWAQRANWTFTILVTWIGGTSATRGSINFKEIR